MLMDYGEWVQAHTADWESTNAAHPDATMQVFRDIIAEADRRLGD